jgi:rubrerythrin
MSKLQSKIQKDKFYYICMNCGRTTHHVNKDGECRTCVIKDKLTRNESFVISG